ncbi:MAG TPA: PAS domain-containing protein [Mucilaginibacter sp.]|jgi:PAS domain S-box-containing protein
MKIIMMSKSQTKPETINEALQKPLKELADYKYAFDESFITAITDQKGIITYVNDNFCKISKYSREELIGEDHHIINSGFHDKKFIRNLWVQIANGKIWRGEFKNKAKDGTYYWVDNTIIPFLNERGKPYKYLAVRADITAKKDAEEKLNKINRLYAFISEINQCIVHLQDEHDLFRNACRIAIEFGKFKMAWIGMFDSKNEKITLVGQNGIPARDVKLFKNKRLEAGSPQLNVLLTGTYCLCNDTGRNLKLENQEHIAVDYGIKSFVVLPIRRAGNIIGTFNLYSTIPDFFDTDEIKLLLEVTGDISFSLDDFEKAKRQKAAEDITAQNEKFFRALIEKSGDMQTMTGKNGEVLYSSPSVAMFSGYTFEELRKKSLFDFFHPDDLPGFVEKRKAMLQAPGGSFYFQARLQHKYGHYIWCEGTTTNLLHESGINALVTNFRDISERVLAAETLSKSESSLKEAQAIAHVGNWEIDITNNANVWSDELYNIFGIPKNEVEPSRELFLSFVHPDDVNFLKKSMEEGYKALRGIDIEFRFIDKGGGIRHGHFESRIKFNDAGNPVARFGIIQDITESVLASEKLSKSESRLKEAQAIAHVGNWEHDLITNAYVWSDELYNIFDITKNEVEPSRELFLSLVHPDDVSFVKKSLEEGYKAPHDVDIEFRFIDKGGGIRHGHFESRIKFDDAGNPVRRVGITQDITERRLFELERIGVLNDLIKRNSELEQFAYIISHNLRAPVANIIGASTALNDPDLSIEDKETLSKGINVSVMRLDDVVKDLNDILEVKKDINTNKEIVRFAALVDDIKLSLLYLINQHGIEIKCDFSAISDLFTLRSYLYSIFHNLISNSIKYRRRDVNTLIEIKSNLVKNKLELIFTDNGIGIDLEKNSNDVFGQYKRFHPDIDGKGLGLFMVKTQVETLGGKISVQSMENEGTEFRIEFDLASHPQKSLKSVESRSRQLTD